MAQDIFSLSDLTVPIYC